MLRKIRIPLAILFWLLITWLLVDFTGTAQAYLGWMAKVQLLPAILALNAGVLIFLVALTLLLGRIYCSVICPLGVMQDAIAWFRKKKNKYSYSPAKNGLRYTILALTGLAFVANLGWVAGLVAPYSTYGRIAGAIVSPLYKMGNNFLAQVAAHYGSYAFYSVDVWMKSGITLAVVLITWTIIAVLAWRGGRTWCNTICPVGTLLGILSRHSVYRPVFDTQKCNSCGLCSRNCKSACIDFKNHSVDMSRCVMCGDCIDKCNKGALQLGQQAQTPVPVKEAPKAANKAPESTERRAVLTGLALVAGATVANAIEEKTVDGGYTDLVEKKKPQRNKLITPPGSLSARNLASHCTACQLCINECPNDVLRPSSSLKRFMQPEVSFERGYCRPECNRCSQVCPTGAIQPVTVEERTAIQVGRATWVRDNCVPVKDGKPCGLCARKCPAQAIQMVPLQAGVHQDGGRWRDADNQEIPREKLLLIPVVNEERCIGCGACENLCPSNPYSAIYVEGNDFHREV